MKKLLISLLTIASIGALAATATSAVFTSQAKVNDNTFATGTLEVRVNGQPGITGFSLTNAAPGDCKSGQFTVNNFGAPWFAGPSTLAAKHLTLSATRDDASLALFNALDIKVEANRGWPTKMVVFDGKLKDLTNADLLSPRWTDLAAGNSEDVYYNVCLPDAADNTLQGLTAVFDFAVDASNP